MSRITLFMGPRNSSSSVSSASNPRSNRLERPTISFLSLETKGFGLAAQAPRGFCCCRARIARRLRSHFSRKPAKHCDGVRGGPCRFLQAWLLTACSRLYRSRGRERDGLTGAISTIVGTGVFDWGAEVFGWSRFGAEPKFSTKSRRFSLVAVFSSKAEALIGKEDFSQYDWSTDCELTNEQNWFDNYLFWPLEGVKLNLKSDWLRAWSHVRSPSGDLMLLEHLFSDWLRTFVKFA